MKIVDRKTFLAMPAGTVFSKYVPCFFEELAIKGGSLSADDFLLQQIHDSIDALSSRDGHAMMQAAAVTGVSVSMNFDIMSRDGCFDYDQLFAVWERADVEALIARLQQALFDSMAA